MGVFDFVKNAGAKIGIGKSTDEEAAEAAAAAAEVAAEAKARAEANTKAAKLRRETRAARKIAEGNAKAAAEDAAAKKLEAAKAKAASAKMKAKAKDRMANYKKSSELEVYVKDMGIDISGVDIRYDDGTAYISGETTDQATRERIILAVGNAHGVGKVDEEIAVVEPADEAHFHTVAPGDTLWALAEKVYGDGNRYPEIFEANKPMLSDPDLIFPGQVLRCP